MFVGGCSADGHGRATRAGRSPTGPRPGAGTGAAAPCMLVGTAWPRAIRIHNAPLERPPLGQARGLSPLFPAIIGRGCVAAAADKAPTGCPRVCRAGPIGSAPRHVAGQLAAHGAGGQPQHRCHCPQRMALGQAYGLTVFGTQVSIGSHSQGSNPVAYPGLKRCTES